MDSNKRELIKNPHLPGDEFLWRSGTTGVLLCHGFTATTAEVRPLAQRLFEHGYTIGAPLLPGHNTHPADLNRYKWQDWVVAVEAMYQELKSTCLNVVVGGESAGGLLSFYLAARHPEIRSVLAYAPALRLNMSIVNQLKLHLIAPFIEYIPKEPSDDDTLWQGYPVIPLKATQQLLMLQKEVLRLLPQLKQPVLLMMGGFDQTVHPVTAAIIQGKLAPGQVELHWMQNSSHVVIIDKELPEVTERTLAFIERHSHLSASESYNPPAST